MLSSAIFDGSLLSCIDPVTPKIIKAPESASARCLIVSACAPEKDQCRRRRIEALEMCALSVDSKIPNQEYLHGNW